MSERTSFIRYLLHMMADRDIDNPSQLYRMLVGYGPSGSEGVSRGTVYGYFRGSVTPQPWFVRAMIEVLELSEDERRRLLDTYIESY